MDMTRLPLAPKIGGSEHCASVKDESKQTIPPAQRSMRFRRVVRSMVKAALFARALPLSLVWLRAFRLASCVDPGLDLTTISGSSPFGCGHASVGAGVSAQARKPNNEIL